MLVSLIFLSPLVGYILSALLNNLIHVKLGQRGIATIGPTCHLIAFLVLAIHPPYPMVVVMTVFAGFGNGVCDAFFNAWIGNMEKANSYMGLLHGSYGVGATASPLIATLMITKGHLQWYSFYYVMVSLIITEILGIKEPIDANSLVLRVSS
jgi:MFS family permease